MDINNLSRLELEKLIKDNKSISEVAKKVGASYSKTRRLIKFHKLKSYPRGQRKKLADQHNFKISKERLINLYQERNMSLRDIANICEVSHQAVHCWLKAYKIPTRSQGKNKRTKPLYLYMPCSSTLKEFLNEGDLPPLDGINLKKEDNLINPYIEFALSCPLYKKRSHVFLIAPPKDQDGNLISHIKLDVAKMINEEDSVLIFDLLGNKESKPLKKSTLRKRSDRAIQGQWRPASLCSNIGSINIELTKPLSLQLERQTIPARHLKYQSE